MRRVLWLVLFLTLMAPLTLAVADSIDTEKLPTDPALVTGRLPNGLRYIIRPHHNPQGRVSIWLHVASGSLNETDSTRGLAHYLEHMAFNGSTNFPPGSVVPFFQSLGLAFGRDQNAFTSFDQTTYQLALPGGGRDVVDKGMLFMSDVAMRLSLEPSAIDSERQVIL
jgi:zinc protease